MKCFIILFILIISNIVSYSELRIYQEEIQEAVISIYDCKTAEQGYNLELTLNSYFVSLSSLQNVSISSIQRSFSPNLFLLIDENVIQPFAFNILRQFSAVFLQKDLYNNKTVFLSQAFLCQMPSETIKKLQTYNILTMSSSYRGQLYRIIINNKFTDRYRILLFT